MIEYSPWMNVLLKTKNTDVMLYASCEPPKSILPMSQISRISGCLRQNRHRTRDVYCTLAATEIVTMTPGTSPRIENDLQRAVRVQCDTPKGFLIAYQGKERMARQMYSLNSRLAV